jgi:anti-sigma factor (TIGR02949 family)
MKPMLDCHAVMRQLWDYLDGELSPDRMDAIREHLKLCDRCQPHAAFGRAFLAALARARREHSHPADLTLRVRRALARRGYSIAAG